MLSIAQHCSALLSIAQDLISTLMRRNIMEKQWLTVAEAAEFLRLGRSTVYRLLREGKLPAHKVGRTWRFDPEELNVWIRTDKAKKFPVADQKGGANG
jgi:excisionase family DNA binding protein